MSDLSPQDEAKRAAGRKAIEVYLRDGMKVGLGSGTTSHWFVRALGEHVRQGLRIVGVPTSNATRAVAQEVGVPLADLNELVELDLTIDGPDEVDAEGRMIKGGGACLLWEKIVACASTRMVVVADNTKQKKKLGKFPLPVEVIRFGWKSTANLLQDLFREHNLTAPIVLRGGVDQPVVTDSGHYILDCSLDRIEDPDVLAPRLNQIPGVVENGLFINIAHEMVVGYADGSTEVVRFPRGTGC